MNIFKECLDNYGEYSGRSRKFPLNKILLLYAVITYLLNKNEISEQDFAHRIRIIRNLIWNSSDEIRDDRMKNLLSETKKIILTGVVPETVAGSLGYNVAQKEEERAKIDWLIDNPDKKDELFHLEDHRLLKGCIAILGLSNSANFNKFRTLFDTCSKDIINNALLTIGDYSQEISWRIQIGAKTNDSVWFDLFHPTKQRIGFENTSRIINQLLSSLNAINEDELKLCIDKYISNPDTLIDWRYYLAKYAEMRKGNFGMYYWEELSKKDYNAIMMNTEKSIGGRNWNIFLYTLSKLPQLEADLSLGEYGYQGDILSIKNTGYRMKSLNDKFVIIDENDVPTDYPIEQNNGFDKNDRITIGEQIIKKHLPSLCQKI